MDELRLVVLGISGKKGAGKTSIRNRLENRLRPRGDVLCRHFAFAEPLKTMCVDVLGLGHGQVHGTDRDKNTPVPHLLWENFPVQECRRVYKPCGRYVERMRAGPMTAREVMQYWGGEIFRRANPDIFVLALRREIRDWRQTMSWLHRGEKMKLVALIDDVRHPNEVAAIREMGGVALRLDRGGDQGDRHKSEVSLDDDLVSFDMVFDNSVVTLDETMTALTPWFKKVEVLS